MAGGLRSGRLRNCRTPRAASGATVTAVTLAAAACGQAYPPMPATVSPPTPAAVTPLYFISSRRVSPRLFICHLHVTLIQAPSPGLEEMQGSRQVPAEKSQSKLSASTAICRPVSYMCRVECMRMTGPLERVLGAFLADPAAPRYGYDLMKAARLPSGTLYPLLARLEQQ